jgi:hypothetical protein
MEEADKSRELTHWKSADRREGGNAEIPRDA